jgi:hypothetical protein
MLQLSLGGDCLKPWCCTSLPQVCPTPQRYKYAYAVVWEGTFTGCHWATGDCIAPLQGDDCVTLRCDNSQVVCPPNCGLLLHLPPAPFRKGVQADALVPQQRRWHADEGGTTVCMSPKGRARLCCRGGAVPGVGAHLLRQDPRRGARQVRTNAHPCCQPLPAIWLVCAQTPLATTAPAADPRGQDQPLCSARVHHGLTGFPPVRWWSHRCNPLAVPSNGTAVRLACEPTPANDTRKFQCYISQARSGNQARYPPAVPASGAALLMCTWRRCDARAVRMPAMTASLESCASLGPLDSHEAVRDLQEGSFMASLGMKCTSGSCLYEPDGPAPPAPVPHEHKTNLVRSKPVLQQHALKYGPACQCLTRVAFGCHHDGQIHGEGCFRLGDVP